MGNGTAKAFFQSGLDPGIAKTIATETEDINKTYDLKFKVKSISETIDLLEFLPELQTQKRLAVFPINDIAQARGTINLLEITDADGFKDTMSVKLNP